MFYSQSYNTGSPLVNVTTPRMARYLVIIGGVINIPCLNGNVNLLGQVEGGIGGHEQINKVTD